MSTFESTDGVSSDLGMCLCRARRMIVTLLKRVITRDDAVHEADLGSEHGKDRNHHVEMETEFALACGGLRVRG